MRHPRLEQLVASAVGDAERFRELLHLLSPEMHRELYAIDQRTGGASLDLIGAEFQQRFGVTIESDAAAMLPSWTVGNFRFALGDRVRAGVSDEVRIGVQIDEDILVPVLVTLTAKHSPPPNIPTAIYAGPAHGDNVPYADALVERLPDGKPSIAYVPFGETELVLLGRELATVVAREHAAARRLGGGIYPELVYVSATRRYTGLCPYGPEFIATAPQPRHGSRSYRTPFVAFEALAMGRPELASDVFALCATLFCLGTGRHPFGDDPLAIISRMGSDQPDPFPGGSRLAEVLHRGLAKEPRSRPTAEELVVLLGDAVAMR